jgi:imidazolonepropionase-like amidohydrolase
MMRPVPARLVFAAFLVSASACTAVPRDSAPASPREAARDAVAPLFDDPFPSSYRAFPSTPTLIRNATVLTGTGEVIEGGSVLLGDGRIAAVGRDIAQPGDAIVIDGTGLWVTPGIIDTHSHLGVYASPGVAANQDGNEMTNPNTAEVWAEHAIWPQDPGFGHALAGGTTSLQILPGSANLFGGRSVTVKNVPARAYQAMKFPDAPHGLKMACGENPKRVYGGQGRSPMTNMGNVAGYRAAWIEADRYRAAWRGWRDDGENPDERPDRNLRLETLAAVLEGDILVHNHCYRADEMVTMIDIAREFGYSIASFHHAVEAYKVRDYLAENDICGSMWADWWGFKLEAYDGILQNVALVHDAGACAIVHSDDGHGIQRLNQEVAKVLGASAALGLEIPKEEAIAWITMNPARALGIDAETGSLEAGKAADVVVWSGDPFSVYSRPEKVFIDGAMMYDRSAPDPMLFGDFILGTQPREAVR